MGENEVIRFDGESRQAATAFRLYVAPPLSICDVGVPDRDASDRLSLGLVDKRLQGRQRVARSVSVPSARLQAREQEARCHVIGLPEEVALEIADHRLEPCTARADQAPEIGEIHGDGRVVRERGCGRLEELDRSGCGRLAVNLEDGFREEKAGDGQVIQSSGRCLGRVRAGDEGRDSTAEALDLVGISLVVVVLDQARPDRVEGSGAIGVQDVVDGSRVHPLDARGVALPQPRVDVPGRSTWSFCQSGRPRDRRDRVIEPWRRGGRGKWRHIGHRRHRWWRGGSPTGAARHRQHGPRKRDGDRDEDDESAVPAAVVAGPARTSPLCCQRALTRVGRWQERRDDVRRTAEDIDRVRQECGHRDESTAPRARTSHRLSGHRNDRGGYALGQMDAVRSVRPAVARSRRDGSAPIRGTTTRSGCARRCWSSSAS